MTWLGFALIIIGGFVFFVGLDNTNIEAPSASDWGNRFIWPGIGIALLGAAMIGFQIFAFVVHLIVGL